MVRSSHEIGKFPTERGKTMKIYGGTEYVVQFDSGRIISAWAFDEEGAQYVASNTSALYGWGKIVSMEAQS